MTKLLLILILFASFCINAESSKDNEWKNTTLSDSTIKSIQMAKYKYMKCISKETEKKRSVEMDTRAATDVIIRACENDLSDIREVFIGEKIPEHIADRYLKKSRTETARNVHKEMMFAAAARKMGR